MFLGFKVANFYRQVLKPLGSYKRDFTVVSKSEMDWKMSVTLLRR